MKNLKEESRNTDVKLNDNVMIYLQLFSARKKYQIEISFT